MAAAREELARVAFVLVIWLLALIVAIVAVGTLHLVRTSKGRPLRGRDSWLLWCAVSALGIGLVAALVKTPFGQGLLLALLLGPLVQPAVRLWFWLEDTPHRLAREREAELERLHYRPVDFAGAAPKPRAAAAAVPTAPPSTETPLTPAPRTSKLAEATAEPRSRWARAGEGLVLGAILGGFALIWIGPGVADAVAGARGVPGRRAMVAAELEILGFEGARLKRDWIQTYCTGGDGEAYRWTSEPADGRACVRLEGVQIKLDRSRLTKDPFARPGR